MNGKVLRLLTKADLDGKGMDLGPAVLLAQEIEKHKTAPQGGMESNEID